MTINNKPQAHAASQPHALSVIYKRTPSNAQKPSTKSSPLLKQLRKFQPQEGHGG
ncbi:uncharacterized protein G2W53_032665 [Senna tora]|uniref:Uncharacterized protein n=1 Tax=Senna tora TaxID=362788 RepID=A0A834SX43_9FABA|nr:uncharacterized protein G2W53_032665 [Senna tora]